MKLLYSINLQFFASKKGVSSTKNGRDSISKRLGAKKGDGQLVKVGNIIYRQRGTKIYPGHNVKMGGDNTLFSLVDGFVKYENFNAKKRVSVYPQRRVIENKKLTTKVVAKK